MTAKPEIMVFLKQKGGVGATDLVAKIAGAFELCGKKVIVLDADNGLRSYKIRHGMDSAISVPPYDQEDADEFLSRQLRRADVVLIDVPGAFATRADYYSVWMWQLLDGKTAQSHSRTFLFVAASNAPGSLDNAVEMSSSFNLKGRQVLVLNDMSGSGEFGHESPPPNMTTMHVGKVDPGIMAALQRWPQTVAEFVRRPERGFHRASSAFAYHVAEVAKQGPIANLLPTAAPKMISRFAADRPQRLAFIVRTAAEAHDSVIEWNAVLGSLRHQGAVGGIGAAFVAFCRERAVLHKYVDALNKAKSNDD